MKRLLKILKITLGIVVGLFVVATAVYFMGPKPAPPTFAMLADAPAARSLDDLETTIAASEKVVKGLKPNNEARIVWADSTHKTRTKVAMLYLHGFGASHMEGAPVDFDLAKTFGCNLFVARLAEHGIEVGDDNLAQFTAEKFVESAEKSLQIARQLGDSVVIVATSAGGAMALFLASRHPDIKALVTYSPAVELFRSDAKLLAGPWGLQLAHLLTGKPHNDWQFRRPEQAKFWTNHQRFEGIVELGIFQKYAMTEATFRRIKCPVFVGYYYENEEKQDKTVSVAAMKRMFDQLATPQYQKRLVDFPNTHSHVLTSDLTSDDWQTVEKESVKFLTEICNMKAK